MQPAAASLASVAESTISSSRPASAATRARNASPFSAARQASVAISRARFTLRARILSRQTSSAATARSIAASLMRREAATPSPRRMMRENASMTRNPSAVGRAIEQAAIVGAEIERRVGGLGVRVYELLSIIIAMGRRAGCRTAFGAASGAAVVALHGRRGRRSAGPPPSSNTFLPRRNSGSTARLGSSSNPGECISRRRQGQYCAISVPFLPMSHARRPACRSAPSPLCDAM